MVTNQPPTNKNKQAQFRADIRVFIPFSPAGCSTRTVGSIQAKKSKRPMYAQCIDGKLLANGRGSRNLGLDLLETHRNGNILCTTEEYKSRAQQRGTSTRGTTEAWHQRSGANKRRNDAARQMLQTGRSPVRAQRRTRRHSPIMSHS